jgi:hypothetical protein
MNKAFKELFVWLGVSGYINKTYIQVIYPEVAVHGLDINSLAVRLMSVDYTTASK